jgi:phosphatidylinositol alpha-1,6-mannosyltransferase
VVVPPGVDHERFRPLDGAARRAARTRFGLPEDGFVVAAVSRLVPRKGFDVLIRAAARLGRTHPDLLVAVAGDGRDRGRLERLASQTGAPVRFLGRVSDGDLPLVYGCADLFAMLCRNRWFGLEQEGFGIVFLEAAAAGVPQVAGRSGGAHEAVVDGRTGLVVDPSDEIAVAGALARLADDAPLRAAMAEAGLARVRTELSYDHLAERLHVAIESA